MKTYRAIIRDCLLAGEAFRGTSPPWAAPGYAEPPQYVSYHVPPRTAGAACKGSFWLAHVRFMWEVQQGEAHARNSEVSLSSLSYIRTSKQTDTSHPARQCSVSGTVHVRSAFRDLLHLHARKLQSIRQACGPVPHIPPVGS